MEVEAVGSEVVSSEHASVDNNNHQLNMQYCLIKFHCYYRRTEALMIASAVGVVDDSFVERRCQRYLWRAALPMIASAGAVEDDRFGGRRR